MNNELQKLEFDFNKLILHPGFKKTIKDLGNIKVTMSNISSDVDIDYSGSVFSKDGAVVVDKKKITKIRLDPSNGNKLINNPFSVFGYDESIDRFDSLEGIAFSAAHTIVLLEGNDYLPASYLTFYFYTKSQIIHKKSEYIKISSEIDRDSKIDFIQDKIKFLQETIPENSILLIDGPLIAGDVYTYFIKPVIEMSKNRIIPIFFIKNSTSNMIINNIKEYKNNYNSDLHWSYNYLNQAERTCFFQYIDKKNPKNSKAFCYLKAFNISPQRVEFHLDTYNRYLNIIPSLMDMIYYFIIVQGDQRNPQVRPIAVAERFARAALKLVNIHNRLKTLGIVPTMNQKRFGW